MALTWQDLFLVGSVVRLQKGKWSGETMIKPTDLGFEHTDAVAKALSLGHHRLVPPWAMNEIRDVSAKADRAIETHSINFQFHPGARFVPEKAMARLMEKLKEVQAEFQGAVDRFVEGYADVASQMKPTIRQALLDATGGDLDVVERAMDRIEACYPSPDTVRCKFYMKWDVYAIKAPNTKALSGSEDTVKDVLTGMVGDLRKEVGDKLTEVLAIVAKGGALSKRSIDSALAVLDRVESVNVFGDDSLNSQIAKLRQSLKTINRGEIPNRQTVEGLEDVRRVLEEDMAAAVAQAEANLTALGRRRLDEE